MTLSMSRSHATGWSFRLRHPIRLAAFAGFLVALAACQSQQAGPSTPLQVVNDKALIFIADSNFDVANLPPEWWRSPPDRAEGFTMTRLGGAPVLRVESPTGLLLGRRFEAPMSERPFLRWSWYLDPAIYQGAAPDGAPRGLRLVLGFRGGNTRDSFDRLMNPGRADLPPYDRMIEIMFGGMPAPNADNAQHELVAQGGDGTRFVLRGPALGQAGSWQVEGIDVAAVYALLWPNDRVNEVQLAFVGLGSLSARLPESPRVTIGYFSEVLLAR
jgi:hypothetical protein